MHFVPKSHWTKHTNSSGSRDQHPAVKLQPLAAEVFGYQCQSALFAMPEMAGISLFAFLCIVLITAPLWVCFISQPSHLSGLIFIQYKCSHYKDLTWGEYKWEDECTLRTCLYRNCIDQTNSRVKHMSALTCSISTVQTVSFPIRMVWLLASKTRPM